MYAMYIIICMVQCPKGCGDYDNLGHHWHYKHDEPFPDGVSKTSEEYRQKISESESGWEPDDDHPINQTGEDHPAFKHGKYTGLHGQKTRAKRRDNFTCQECGKHDSELDTALEVHHIDGQIDHSLDNLVTLCSSCHANSHSVDYSEAAKQRYNDG